MEKNNKVVRGERTLIALAKYLEGEGVHCKEERRRT